MQFHFSDFTENNYIELLKLAKTRYAFSSFPNIFSNKKNIALWRHDIDFSIHRALTIAKLESKENIQSTYFIQLGSSFYNIFEQENKNKIFQIIEHEHFIGLHFDPSQYKVTNQEELEYWLKVVKEILEKIFQIEINVFSFHNPTKSILKYNSDSYCSMINTYSSYIKDNFSYCSDSNGYWRYTRLKVFLKQESNSKIHVLTHPAWWQKSVLSPKMRIWNCINGRANCIRSNLHGKYIV